MWDVPVSVERYLLRNVVEVLFILRMESGCVKIAQEVGEMLLLVLIEERLTDGRSRSSERWQADAIDGGRIICTTVNRKSEWRAHGERNIHPKGKL